MPRLSACPVCRTVLDRPEVELETGAGEKLACSTCGADLLPYLELKSHAEDYLDLARQLLSQRETEKVRELLSRLPQLIGLEELDLAEISARLAILEGDFERAADYAQKCPRDLALQLQTDIELHQADRLRAQELYNYALSTARQGQFKLAAAQLAKAVVRDPRDPALWQLKLKVDLRSANYVECYEDLKALDALSARPPEFYRLEELLPPVPPGA